MRPMSRTLFGDQERKDVSAYVASMTPVPSAHTVDGDPEKGKAHYITFQCNACRHQTSLIAGTLFEGTKLGLRVWFLAIYLISQAKTGLSALALKRDLGVSYPTAWLIQHKLMQAMVEREAGYLLCGSVQVDDAYLGGELNDGTAGRGSENKVPFVAAVSLDDEGHPLRAKFTPVPGFTRKAIAAWASDSKSRSPPFSASPMAKICS